MKSGVNRIDGQIIAMEDKKPVSCYEKLNIYTLFGYASSCARIIGTWVRFDQLNIARILLPLQVGDELQKTKKNACLLAKSML